jgi:hypothetical protein
MDKKKLDKLVDETINSMDNAERATPAPYLLTRIQAKMNKETASLSAWERISSLLGKPLVALPSLVLVLLLNFWIIRSSVSDSNSSSAADFGKVSSDDYSLSTATSLFDFENGQR